MGLDMYLHRHYLDDAEDGFDDESFDCEVGYWHKANHIHKWFNDTLEGSENCEAKIVTKSQLLELLALCEKVMTYAPPSSNIPISAETEEILSELLPTQAGFFFGDTDYGVNYFLDVELTIKTLKEVISETDFDTQCISYYAWW